MQVGTSSFKIRGMQRDNAESVFDPSISFENMNMQILTKDKNTQLSLTNKKGNQIINIEDAKHPGKDLDIIGIPIGKSVLNDNLIIFTTENIFPEDNLFDTVQVVNRHNIFTLESLVYNGFTDKTIKFSIKIGEEGNPKVSNKLAFSMYCSFVIWNGLDYTMIKTTLTGDKITSPSDPDVYVFTIPEELNINLAEAESMLIHNLYITYEGKQLMDYYLVKMFKLDTINNDIVNWITPSFPSYRKSTDTIEDAESIYRFDFSVYFPIVLNGIITTSNVVDYEITRNTKTSDTYQVYIYNVSQKTWTKSVATNHPLKGHLSLLPVTEDNKVEKTETYTDAQAVLHNPKVKVLEKIGNIILYIFDRKNTTVAVEETILSTVTKTVDMDDTFKLTLTISPQHATDKTIVWTSDNPVIVSIEAVKTFPSTSMVTVKANTVGSTIIRGTTTDGSNLVKTCQVIVQNNI